MVAFNERIQPRGVGRGVYLLDAENFAEMGEGGPKELWCIISDQVFWAREIADQVLQDKAPFFPGKFHHLNSLINRCVHRLIGVPDPITQK